MNRVDESYIRDLLQKANTSPLINGRFSKVDPAKLVEQRSPVDGRELTPLFSSSRETVDEAVRAARKSFTDGRWFEKSLHEKKEILFRFALGIEAEKKALAVMDTISMGKSIRDCLERDIPAAINCLRWFAEAVDKFYDRALPPRFGSMGIITREPIGVVGAISAWNYPVENVIWKVAPALVAGNSIVLKPAEYSTLSALRLGEIALEAGIPPGVLNIVPGEGIEAGRYLASHNDVNGIYFTGSSAVGRKIMQYASDSNMKRVSLECGGKSAFVVLDTCKEVEKAAKALAYGIFSNQGQTCSAPSRLIVEKNMAHAMIELLINEVSMFQPANPLSYDCKVGALASHSQQQRVLGFIESGRYEGANLLCGGGAAQPVDGGAYISPTIFSDVDSSMTIAREEIFGPVLVVQKVDSIAEAAHVANDSRYALSASIWSQDIDQALCMARKLQAGTVHVNSYGEDDMTAPFGGFKESGTGAKEKSLDAIAAYSQQKTTWIKLNEKVLVPGLDE